MFPASAASGPASDAKKKPEAQGMYQPNRAAEPGVNRESALLWRYVTYSKSGNVPHEVLFGPKL